MKHLDRGIGGVGAKGLRARKWRSREAAISEQGEPTKLWKAQWYKGDWDNSARCQDPALMIRCCCVLPVLGTGGQVYRTLGTPVRFTEVWCVYSRPARTKELFPLLLSGGGHPLASLIPSR